MAHFSTFAALAGLLALAGMARGQAVSFAPAVDYSTGIGSYPRAVAIADFNADTRPDVVIAGDFGAVSILLGNGDGTFQSSVSYSAGLYSSPYGVAAADVNGDDILDVVTANSSTGTVGVLLGNGNGTFQSVATYLVGSSTSAPQNIAVADLNHDSFPDLIVGTYYGTAVVLLNTGSGTFPTSASYAVGTSRGTRQVTTGDVNGDGYADLLAANFDANAVAILLNNGNGAMQAATTYPLSAGSNPYCLAVADFAGRAKLDIAAADYGTGTVSILPGNGNGTFQTSNSYPVGVGSQPQSIATADVNRDGYADIITAVNGANTVVVLVNDHTGSFQNINSYALSSSSYPYGVAVADVNGDGRVDLVTANHMSSTVSVLLNTTPLPTRPALPGTTATLAPNPAAEATTLKLNGLPATVARVQAAVLDATGREVARHMLAARQGVAHTELPTTGLAPGLYVVRLRALDGQDNSVGELATQRLSVQ